MKTIRYKIISLFTSVTTATILIVLMLFNIAIYVYFDRATREELQNTFSAMDILIEKRLTDSLMKGGRGNESSALSGLGAALTASHLSGNTEFFIFDESFSVLFRTDAENSLLNDSLLQYVKTLNFEAGSMEIHKSAKNGCYVAGMPFDKLEGTRLYIVFAAGTQEGRELIFTINFLLIAIMLISALIGVLLARAAADRISRPIQRACEYAAEIGNGNFLDVPPDKSSVEIAQLSSGIAEMSCRLRAADQAHKQFLQNASHELRTPLMSIQGYAEAIEQGIGYSPSEAAAIIKAESIRLTALVEELLTLSRMENNIYAVAPENIDLGDLISEYVYRLEGAAFREKKQIIWKSPEKEMIVSADEQLINQAVGNIVSNCLRYAEKQVRLTLKADGDYAVLTISDDGPGIAEGDLPNIFNRFYKGKNGKFGLGLAIAKKAVDLMGGDLTAANGEKGAVFSVRLRMIG